MIFEQRWVLGRDPANEVVVADEYASPVHCEVVRTPAGLFYVRDAGSTNGTYIRDPVVGRMKVVGWMMIVPGQTLVVGRSEIPWAPR